MQFKGPKSRNFKKLKEISRNRRCHICDSKLKNSGVFIWSRRKEDAVAIKCCNCLTTYSTDFNILDLGIPREVGYA
jgi:hypothetical protein